jgi:hypothetical protein
MGKRSWINLAQNWEKTRGLVNQVTGYRPPNNVGYSLTGWTTVSFSRRTHLHVVSYSVAETENYSFERLDEWHMNWKVRGRNRPWPISRHYIRIFLDGLWVTTKTWDRIVGMQAEIRTADLPNIRDRMSSATLSTATLHCLYFLHSATLKLRQICPCA